MGLSLKHTRAEVLAVIEKDAKEIAVHGALARRSTYKCNCPVQAKELWQENRRCARPA